MGNAVVQILDLPSKNGFYLTQLRLLFAQRDVLFCQNPAAFPDPTSRIDNKSPITKRLQNKHQKQSESHFWICEFIHDSFTPSSYTAICPCDICMETSSNQYISLSGSLQGAVMINLLRYGAMYGSSLFRRT